MQLGKYAVPAGSSVFVASYVMQRDPELWPRAGEFLPERWLPVSLLLGPCVLHVACCIASQAAGTTGKALIALSKLPSYITCLRM
jgi:cytochrome P450